MFARAIHHLSKRRGQFCAVNVAGLDDTMFSDTLFGHKPGAFTGAVGVRKGMIEAAGRGTLFLDEIGDLSEASQVKLLRVLQERKRRNLLNALQRANGKISGKGGAAEMLGIKPSTLESRMKAFGMGRSS